MGLWIQHGCQCYSGCYPECNVELVQFQPVSEIWTLLGDVARFRCGLDYVGYELGVARFPTLVGLLGRAQFVASGHCCADDDFLQVSYTVPNLIGLHTNMQN